MTGEPLKLWADVKESVTGMMVSCIVVGICPVLYLIATTIACRLHCQNVLKVFLVNMRQGGTSLGWLGVLYCSCTEKIPDRASDAGMPA